MRVKSAGGSAPVEKTERGSAVATHYLACDACATEVARGEATRDGLKLTTVRGETTVKLWAEAWPTLMPSRFSLGIYLDPTEKQFVSLPDAKTLASWGWVLADPQVTSGGELELAASPTGVAPWARARLSRYDLDPPSPAGKPYRRSPASPGGWAHAQPWADAARAALAQAGLEAERLRAAARLAENTRLRAGFAQLAALLAATPGASVHEYTSETYEYVSDDERGTRSGGGDTFVVVVDAERKDLGSVRIGRGSGRRQRELALTWLGEEIARLDAVIVLDTPKT